MKEFYTEFDEIQEALKRVPINEPVMSYVNGRLVENEQSYNKIQKLLDCSEMADCHKYLYDLDVEDLDDEDIGKIDKLFDLGVKKGYIDNSFDEEFQKEQGNDEEAGECAQCRKTPQAGSCWTVLYSATNNGQTKCGECYSTAADPAAAKADCMQKLANFGYENVTVLAVEAGGSCNEDDMLLATPHNGKAVHNGHKETLQEKDGCCQSKNPYAAGAKLTGMNEDDDSDTGSDDSGDADVDDADSDDTGGADTDDAGSDDSGSDDTDSDDAGDDDSDDADSGDSDDSEGGDSEDDGEESGDDSDSDDSEDGEGDDSEDGEGDDSEDGDSEDGGDDEESELSDEEKANLRDEYTKVFRQTMVKCKYEDKAFNDLTIKEKVKFFEELGKAWTKNEPSEFMTDKEEDQLETVVVQKD